MEQRDALRFVTQLTGDLEDFGMPEVDEALEYLLGAAGKTLRAENSQLAICVRDPEVDGPPPAGWRPAWGVRRGPDSAAYSAGFNSWYADRDNYPSDATVVALAQTAGTPRAFLRREVVDDDQWTRSPVKELFDELAIGDRLVTGVPVCPDTEVVLTSYRRRTEQAFTLDDRELAMLLAAAVRSFCRRLALTHGFGVGQRTHLTPRERTVLKALLTGAAEKEIAWDLGLSVRSLHQYVVAVYRKLGVSSRALLMAQFISANRA